MKTNTRNKREQKAWERSQTILALRREEENEKTFNITLQARKRLCR